MDQYGVLVFHDQRFTTTRSSRSAAISASLSRRPAMTRAGCRAAAQHAHVNDISNLDDDNQVLARDNRRRLFAWATGCGIRTARSRRCRRSISLLSARVIPSAGGNTEFADMRAAYDALDDETRAECEDLVCEHSQLYSRATSWASPISPTTSAADSRRCCNDWCAAIRRPAASRCSSPRMPARSSAGRCRRRAPSCAT